MKAFDIKVNGKILDYRKSRNLDLNEARKFFEQKYIVKKIWQAPRHVLGLLEKDGRKLFLKLSPTEGIGAVTQIERNWNNEFNKLVDRSSKFWVPKNFENGFYKENLFYLITDYFQGQPFAERPSVGLQTESYSSYISEIIDLSELIQGLKINKLSEKDEENYNEWFLEKTKSWYNEIPQEIIEEYKIYDLLKIVSNNYLDFQMKTRHGDFTPWHMIDVDGKIGLIDGEHAMKNGVEYYDIGYFIQRVFSVLGNSDFAKHIIELLAKRNYDLEKLRAILAARAIGGFTDEVLLSKQHDFAKANKFKEWVINLA